MARKIFLIVSLAVVFVALCIYLVETLSSSNDPSKQYLATVIVFRHAEKTSTAPIGNIPCEICEDLGYGQITKNGSLQLYNQGVFLRKKYLQLFSAHGEYRERDMRILSTVSARASMSLQSFMTGFLSQNREHALTPFNYDLDYAGRLIHVRLDWDSCPRYSMQLNESLQQPPISLLFSENKELFDSLPELFQMEINSIWDLFMLIDALNIYKTLARDTLPKWAEDLYDSKFSTFNNLVLFHMHLNSEMVRFRVGMVMTEIIENMRLIAGKTGQGRRFSIYSGHDATVFTFAFALGLVEQLPTVINHGDTLMIDLIAPQDDSEEAHVQVIYMSFEDGSYLQFPMKVNGEESWPLSAFVVMTRNLVTTESEIDEYCERV